MIKKEITLCGKQVVLAYCFATEISYKLLAEEEITDFVVQAVESLQDNRMPDTRKSIYAILSAATAYYDSIDKDLPITDKEIMFKATSADMATAIGTFIGLRADFYRIPASETTVSDSSESEEEEEEQGKNP